MELLLHEKTDSQIATILNAEDIRYIAINWRFFLRDNNADRLGEGETRKLVNRFEDLINKGILIPMKQFGPVWIYSIESSSDDAS